MNNDLIKRIDESFFFVVDSDGQQRLNKLLNDCRAEIESLRQAIAEPVEPVAYVDLDFLKEDSHAYAFVKRHNSRQTPLYTTPPSVDALIAEAVAKEREACAQLCSGLVKSQVVRSWASHDELEAFDYCANKIRARGQK